MNNYYKMSNKTNNSITIKKESDNEEKKFKTKINKNKKEKSKKNINELDEISLLKIRKLKRDKQLYLENIISNLKKDISNINNRLLTVCNHEWKRDYDDGPENRTDYICNKCYNYKSYINRIL